MGGGISLVNSKLNDVSSTYSYNGAILGGGIYCNTCQLTLVGITFDHNSAYDGGTIYFYDHIDPHTSASNVITYS
jgi:hypothetical protein